MLCKDMGCTPSELRNEDPDKLQLMFRFYQAMKEENPLASLF